MNFLEDSKMECIEARALKSSVLSQMAAVNPDHANSQPLFNCNDDVWCIAAFNSSDDTFPVDDLLNLDFPDKDIIHDACFSQFDAAAAAAADHQTNSNSNSDSNYSSTTFSAADELAVLPDDLDNLEWLSQFVDDDTPPGLSLLCPIESFTNRGSANRGKRIDTLNRPVQNMRVPFLASPVPRKARSERLTRPSGRRPWFLAAAPPPMSAAESSTTTSSNGSSVLPPPPLFEKPAVLEQDWFYSVEKPPAKKQRKAPEEDSGRRCTHCQVDKTPQWRTGPRGPKTLCNACGVRYKSGRLFPEYRPACSPTFSKEAHSNSHRRVLEMRRKKEMTQGCEPGSTWPIRNC